MKELPRLLRLRVVVEITGIKKSQLFKAVKRGIFPRPVRILESGRAVGWIEDEVRAYLAGRIALRDAVPLDAKPKKRLGRPPKTIPTSAAVAIT
jgi:prophage regulatory protein